MRPNTPHCVYTHGHTICHGGHFYPTSCLQDTLFSLIHSFVAGNLVTNTEHEASRLLLRRMVQFYHLALVGDQITLGNSSSSHAPRIDTSEGVLDLFSICILTELSNVLNLVTYSTHGMAPNDRENCIQARHRSRDLLDWFFANYELVRPGTETPAVLDGKNEVYWPYVVRIVEGLTRYKKLASDNIQDTIKGCTTASVKKEIEACFRGVAEYHAATSFWGTEPVESLAWPTDDQYKFTVQKLTTPKPRQRKSTDSISTASKNSFLTR
ncbi:hypothetical protein BDZ94DRAFT_1180331 [Collybia nuda]|uniref:Uncharacterized protein n=1 Tax=Collybia nuda TaxID=64659 RepID=A0A9P5XPG2_9AGAR|nr:hypothetical protein BDZ94DRAFT_1180331 [Collybia nuda]